jgi:hypothetical protein
MTARVVCQETLVTTIARVAVWRLRIRAGVGVAAPAGATASPVSTQAVLSTMVHLRIVDLSRRRRSYQRDRQETDGARGPGAARRRDLGA